MTGENTAKKLIDTSVLVYAYERTDREKHAIAAALLARLQEEGESILSIQNLAEFGRVVSEKLPSPLPCAEARLCVGQLSGMFTVITYKGETVLDALSLSSAHNVHFFDALLAATMKENYISEIITENEKDFARIPGIKAVNPFKR